MIFIDLMKIMVLFFFVCIGLDEFWFIFDNIEIKWFLIGFLLGRRRGWFWFYLEVYSCR